LTPEKEIKATPLMALILQVKHSTIQAETGIPELDLERDELIKLSFVIDPQRLVVAVQRKPVHESITVFGQDTECIVLK
jgi:hypothetical protein